jgi:uncharacterized protein (DUF983 family)
VFAVQLHAQLNLPLRLVFPPLVPPPILVPPARAIVTQDTRGVSPILVLTPIGVLLLGPAWLHAQLNLPLWLVFPPLVAPPILVPPVRAIVTQDSRGVSPILVRMAIGALLLGPAWLHAQLNLPLWLVFPPLVSPPILVPTARAIVTQDTRGVSPILVLTPIGALLLGLALRINARLNPMQSMVLLLLAPPQTLALIVLSLVGVVIPAL